MLQAGPRKIKDLEVHAADPTDLPALTATALPAVVASASNALPASNPKHDKQEVQILQQRLLLLNHAIKCTAGPAECSVSRHCGYMRKLWPHMLECKRQRCKVDHCVSSRYVLSHYGDCRDKLCAICPRVKESMKRDRTNSDPYVTKDQDDSSSGASKRPRQLYWWATEQLLQYKQTISIPGHNASHFQVEGLNRNISQLSLMSTHSNASDDSNSVRSTHSANSMSTVRSYSTAASPVKPPRGHSRSSSPYTRLQFSALETSCTSTCTGLHCTQGSFHGDWGNSYIGSLEGSRNVSFQDLTDANLQIANRSTITVASQVAAP